MYLMQFNPQGLTPASFIMVKGPNDAEGKVVARPYTPTTSNGTIFVLNKFGIIFTDISFSKSDVKGHFDLVIKAYPTGVVSSYMHGLKVGPLFFNNIDTLLSYCNNPPSRWAIRSRSRAP